VKKRHSSIVFLRLFNIVDLITIAYLLITGIFIAFHYSVLHDFGSHLLARLGFIFLLGFILYVQSRSKRKWIELLHWIFPLLLLTYLFKETAYLNHLFFHYYLDGWIVKAEERLWGYLPAVVFSKNFPEVWFSELMNFGYFSYYFMTIGVALLFFFKYPREMERVTFIVLISFFIYYLFYIFFPTEGPVYFLQAPLNERLHSGVFSYLVNLADRVGDGHTGAFPSSHVGMAVIFVILTYKKFPKLFWLVTFLGVLICFATVYIKAHYFLDVVGGLLSAPLLYISSNMLYNKVFIKTHTFVFSFSNKFL